MTKVTFATESKIKVVFSIFDFKSTTLLKESNIEKYLAKQVDDQLHILVKSSKKIGQDIALAILELKLEEACLKLNFTDEILADIAASVMEYVWTFRKYKTTAAPKLSKLDVLVKNPKRVKEYYQKHEAVLAGLSLCKTLAVEPANVMDPKTFAETCLPLKEFGIEVEIFDKSQLQKLGMNALLGVAQGSSKEPRMVVMRYIGDPKLSENIAFVGKGVCFDAGGLFVKDQKSMPLMKYDKSGAAAVVGGLLAIAKNKLKTNVIGVIGLVENMPDGNAQRPSDVVKSMSGKTIEVADTDAEGRLVLADCLYYTHKHFKPKYMLSLATLTYATVVCLANQYAGLFTRNDHLATQLLEVGEKSGNKLWRLPLGEAFQKHIESDIADIKNLGQEGFGENAAAAEFLHEFVGESIFAHLDIAGVSWYTEHENLSGHKGATGYGVKLLHELALSR